MRNIVLIGFMGAGKTTVAEALGKIMNTEPLDADEEIEKRESMPVREIFSQKGEPYFRECETQLLQDLGESDGPIISCGGGMALKAANRALMKKCGKVVLLTAEIPTIIERVGDAGTRPLLKGRVNKETIGRMLSERMPAYEDAADLIIATDGKDPEHIAKEILEDVSALPKKPC